MKSAQSPEVGKAYEVRYPFVRCTFTNFDEDGPFDDEGWRPGFEFSANKSEEGADPAADKWGKVFYSVIDVHKPGKFPTRVFYTRSWEDPDGRRFGKGTLRMVTLEKFNRMLKGMRQGLYVDGYWCNGWGGEDKRADESHLVEQP